MSGNGFQDPSAQGAETNDVKGKGKAVAEDNEMMDVEEQENDDDDDDASEEEEENDDDDEGDDDLKQQGINLENVLGRRTRGVVIDYAKAAAENPAEDEDEEDDDDFEADDMDEE